VYFFTHKIGGWYWACNAMANRTSEPTYDSPTISRTSTTLGAARLVLLDKAEFGSQK
jgi:hypothetical protein